jgi:hypothetical protein
VRYSWCHEKDISFGFETSKRVPSTTVRIYEQQRGELARLVINLVLIDNMLSLAN